MAIEGASTLLPPVAVPVVGSPTLAAVPRGTAVAEAGASLGAQRRRLRAAINASASAANAGPDGAFAGAAGAEQLP